MSLLLVTTWALSHHYLALDRDGQLYAFQAMAELNPSLRADVYLAGISQDDFSLFSPLYALAIRWLGLMKAGAVLFALCTASFYIATLSVARSLWDRRDGWLATSMVIMTVGSYGAWHVFWYSESYLTARTMAEALVIVSLACHLKGLRWQSWFVAAVSMLVHPIMTFPGILLLIVLSIPLLYSAIGAVAGALVALLISLFAVKSGSPSVHIMSGDWLYVVRERSQFLFLQDWSWSDWEFHARALFCLCLAAMVADGPQIRRICIGAALVGVAGLVVALIAGSIGPVAILLQGQAWRWFWLASFVSTLVLLPTAIRLWSEGGCGSVCAALLVSSWTFPVVNGTYVAAAALCLWCARKHVQPPTKKILKAAAWVLVAVLAAWTAANIWSLCTSPPVARTGEMLVIERMRSVFGLQIPALALVGLLLQWIRSGAGYWAFAGAAGILTTMSAVGLTSTVKLNPSMGSEAEVDALAQWRDAIPPTRNVLVLPEQRTSSFVWFSLQRPNYLTVTQSSGVVFSSITALEVQRRAEVLLPVMDPDYKLRTRIAKNGERKQAEKGEALGDYSQRPLTRESLIAICSDPQLGFVVSKEDLGFGAIRSEAPGAWKDWELYDCGHVLRQGSAP